MVVIGGRINKMASSKKLLLIPFDEDGDMLRYTHPHQKPVWRENYVFETMLQYSYAERGRSAATFYWEDPNEVEYSMMWGVFQKMMPTLTLVNGCIPKRKWTFKKQGSNYSIIPFEED